MLSEDQTHIQLLLQIIQVLSEDFNQYQTENVCKKGHLNKQNINGVNCDMNFKTQEIIEEAT